MGLSIRDYQILILTLENYPFLLVYVLIMISLESETERVFPTLLTSHSTNKH